MKITVFWQEGFPMQKLETDLAARLEARSGVEVVRQDLSSLLVHGVLGEVFANGHGEVYPVVIEDVLYRFFEEGGGLLHFGGRPFETALKWEGGVWREVVRTLGDIRDHKGFGPLDAPLDYFRAKLGYTPYELSFEPDSLDGCVMKFDPAFVGCEDVTDGMTDQSLNLATTMQMRILKPELDLTDHRAYQARPAVRETLFPGALYAPDGTELSKVFQLTKAWGNPYAKDQMKVLKPWAVYCGGAGDSLPEEIVETALLLLKCPVFLKEAQLEAACLHEGETGTVRGVLTGPLPKGWKAVVMTAPQTAQEIREGKRPDYHEIGTVLRRDAFERKNADSCGNFDPEVEEKLPANDAVYIEAHLPTVGYQTTSPNTAAGNPKDQEHGNTSLKPMEGDAIRCNVSFDHKALVTAIRFELRDESGRLRDYLETGVAMWKPEQLKTAVKVDVNGQYFDLQKDGKVQESCWVSGTNWQDRHLFALSFHNPNPLRIAKDAGDMANTGMTFVRPHYFMPGWFRSVPGKVYEDVAEDFFDSFEAGPELSERHMRALEAHVMAFGAMGLCYMPSVYTSLGANMGSPSHWMGTSRLFQVRWQIENQKIFARQMMERFGGIPCISWDLINEPDTGMDHAGGWLSEHKEIWGKTGQMVGIGCIGFIDNLLLGESADWHSLHGKTGTCLHSGKPFLIQEAHYPVPSTYEGEDELEERLNSCFANTLRDGGAGIMPWNWNMSFMNWRFRGGWVDFWDLHLGICTHPDGTPRRGKALMRNWDLLLKDLSFDQKDHRQVVFVYPKQCLPGKGSYEYLDSLRDRRICYCAVNDKDLEEFDLSATKLVIFPLYGLGYRRSSYEKAVEFARQGGVVFAHNENLLLDEDGNPDFSREIPEKPETVPVGTGRFEWCLGWNFDANFGCPFPDIVRLEEILDSMNLQKRPVGVRRLSRVPASARSSGVAASSVLEKEHGCVCGTMEFEEVFVCGRHGMLYDWGSLEPWNDENETVRIVVRDESGRVVRAWTRGGRGISVDGYTFASPGDLFFLRDEAGRYRLAGSDITVSGRFESIGGRLVSPYGPGGAWKDTGICVEPETIPEGVIYHLRGWQRMNWLDLEIL